MSHNVRQMAKAILVGGLVAGTIDIGAACLINHASPVFILHVIASGVMGQASYHGGSETVLWGLLLQWGMSWTIAGVYVVMSSFSRWLARRWVTSGLVYGIGVFVVMNYIVIPLSAVMPAHYWTITRLLHRFSPEKFIEALLAMFLFGLIVAFFTYYFTSSGLKVALSRERLLSTDISDPEKEIRSDNAD